MAALTTTPAPIRYDGHVNNWHTGYAWKTEGAFTLVSASSHPNSPKHWVPSSKVQAR
ncbi:hypothetical protein SEA_MAGRITTE_164 [Microbacterium phage Magritte]|nr:hypothetical protein SEA_MAGRITTE_164 [Microbacterium phage Magritte]